MKSFPLFYTGALFLLFLKYGYAVILWDAYHWTESDRNLINARGGDREAESKVCEVIRGHVFTGGYNHDHPGCGGSWCCQKRDTLWKCSGWSARDLLRIRALGGGAMAERKICDEKIDHMFTAGQNQLLPGCGTCSCCQMI